MATIHTAMRRIPPLVLTLALLGTLACVEWRVETPPSAGSRAASRLPSRIRIETQAGQSMLLWDPEIRGDTLFGLTADAARPEPPAPVGIAIADVRRFEARRASPARSAGLALGILVGTIVGLEVVLGGPGS